MTKRGRRSELVITNDSINPGLVGDIKTRKLFDGEILTLLRKKLKCIDNYDVAKSLLENVTVLRDRMCWVLNEDWSLYSRFSNRIAHRLSYELFVSEIGNGKIICHKCDRKGCINFDHLFQGTNKDNRDDFINKYREYKKARKPGDTKEVLPWNQMILKEEKILVIKSKDRKVREPVMDSEIKDLVDRLKKISGEL